MRDQDVHTPTKQPKHRRPATVGSRITKAVFAERISEKEGGRVD